MSPRPYNLGRRQAQVVQGRRQVLDAARALLADTGGYSAFTVEAVARRADVARATVYYQFGAKTGLLEAVCDDLADSGGLDSLGEVFAQAEPREALRRFVVAFARFWSVERIAMRRLRALAALDPEVEVVIARRDQRRRDGLAVIVGRLPGLRRPERERLVRILLVVTSFESFDRLAGPEQPLSAATPDLVRVALAAADGAGVAGRPGASGTLSGGPRRAAPPPGRDAPRRPADSRSAPSCRS